MWAEVDFDAAVINLPGERTKSRQPHIVPLSGRALAILRTLQDAAGASSRDHVFGRGARGFQGWSKSKAELDARNTAARKGHPLDWTLHDFRRSLSTTLHDRFAVPPHLVEAVLGHVSGHRAGVAGTYNKALYLDERRRALEHWGAHVIALVTGKPVEGKVMALPRKRH